MKAENQRVISEYSNRTFVLVLSIVVAAILGLCSLAFSECAYGDIITSVNGKNVTAAQGKFVKKNGSTTYRYKKVVAVKNKSTNGKTVKKAVGPTLTARNVFLKRGTKEFYITNKGQVAKGWTKIKSNYYYFDRSNGVQTKGTTKKKAVVDGIKIRKDGTAVQTAYSVKKINTMMTARKIMLANTKPTDSKSLKRYKVFKWVMKGNYRRFRTLKSTGHRKGWELSFANDMFKHNRLGCCVSNACAFGFLAKECGYDNVLICDDTSHGFVVIGGRYFDTLFAETNGMRSYYNAPKSWAKKDFLVNSLKI